MTTEKQEGSHWALKVPRYGEMNEGQAVDRIFAIFQENLTDEATPDQISETIAQLEPLLANYLWGAMGTTGDYLYCDHAAELMGRALTQRSVDHDVVIGRNYSGDSHIWIEVASVKYDPTQQGCGCEEERIKYRF